MWTMKLFACYSLCIALAFAVKDQKLQNLLDTDLTDPFANLDELEDEVLVIDPDTSGISHIEVHRGGLSPSDSEASGPCRHPLAASSSTNPLPIVSADAVPTTGSTAALPSKRPMHDESLVNVSFCFL